MWGSSVDNVVWGSTGIDNVVWGSAGLVDNIIWGSSTTDTVLWGSNLNEVTAVWPDEIDFVMADPTLWQNLFVAPSSAGGPVLEGDSIPAGDLAPALEPSPTATEPVATITEPVLTPSVSIPTPTEPVLTPIGPSQTSPVPGGGL